MTNLERQDAAHATPYPDGQTRFDERGRVHTVTREEFIASVLKTDPLMTRESAERLADHDLPKGRCEIHGGRDRASCAHAYRDDAEWLYGNGPAGLRRQAAESLAAEFGTDAEEWLV